MHYLAFQRLHVSRLHPATRVVLTLYVLSVLVAMWVAVLKYTDRTTFTPEGVATYVRGSEALAADDPFADPFAGTEEGLVLHEPMTRPRVADIVHPHLFTVPIVLFVLGHLLLLTRLPTGWKIGLNVVAFGACLTTFLAPFALLDADASQPASATVLIASGALLVASVVAMCAVLLWECWVGRPADAPP